MSISVTNNRKPFIIDMIKFNSYKSYLELGVDSGKNIYDISITTSIKCVGVDTRSPRIISNFTFYKGTTDTFFINNINTFDIIFIDACHKIDFVKKDFINSLKCLNKNGMILLHDIDPTSIEFIDDIGTNYSSNAYKMINWVYKNYPELNIIIMPIDEAGLAVVNRKIDRRIYNYMEESNV